MQFLKLVPLLGLATVGGVCAAETPTTTSGPVVVTATRFAEPRTDQPVNMTVITAQDIHQSAAKTVPDLLSEQAGVAIHDFYGNNADSTMVDLRGFGATGGQNTLILLNGRRLTAPDLAGVQWSSIPLSAIDRIEILRGGGAVLYGDGATAGVINIITKSPVRTGNHATLRGSIGSYDTRQGSVNANLFGESAGINFTASNYESDGYRDNNHDRQLDGDAKLTWLTENGSLAFKAGIDNQSIRLPGGRTVQPSAGIDQLATDRRGTDTPLDYATRDGNHAALDWQAHVGAADFDVGLGYRTRRQTSYFFFSGFPDYRITDLDIWSFTPRARLKHRLFGTDNTLVVGVDWYRWGYNLRHSNDPSNIGQPIDNIDATQENTAVYIRNTTKLNPRTTLTAGARRERYHISASDIYDATAPGAGFGAAATPGSQTDTENAFELGLRYQLTPHWAATAKFERSFRFANIDEIYGFSATGLGQFKFLLPQTARTWEAGAEWHTHQASLRASVFRMDVDNEIHLDAYTAGIGNTNLPPSRRQGLELNGQWQATPALTLRTAYTYTDARFREGVLPGSSFSTQNVDIAGKAVPLVPRHQFTLGASWAVAPQTQLNLSGYYASSQFMDNDEGNTFFTKIPAYTVVNFKVVHRSGPWRISGAINNLFDQHYYTYAVRTTSAADRYSAYPLPG
ncbi:MAG TPA: TonB-dependent receptor, partial [Burkholderiales bacterium]|nr:TonB-dependent receptor [Burkholderiales bacterium]